MDLCNPLTLTKEKLFQHRTLSSNEESWTGYVAQLLNRSRRDKHSYFGLREYEYFFGRPTVKQVSGSKEFMSLT